MTMQWINYYQDFFGNRLKWKGNGLPSEDNENYDVVSRRRYNYSPATEENKLRLVFPKNILKRYPTYKTLVREGRAIWCYNIKYEGVGTSQYRQFSFNLKGGKKRFVVEERDALCIPAHCSVIPAPWRPDHKVFTPFGTLFGYDQAMRLMFRSRSNLSLSYEDFVAEIDALSPFKPGALVRPRTPYYYPRLDRTQVLLGLADKYCRHEPESFIPVGEIKEYLRNSYRKPPPGWGEFMEWCHTSADARHPYGLVLASGHANKKFYATQYYRVSFGEHIYENIHPFELEIVKDEV